MLGIALPAAQRAHAEPPPAPEWVKSWNGPWNHSDESQDVAILPDGSVIVAGTAYQTSVGDHPALLRYSVDGQLLWSVADAGLSSSLTPSVLIASSSGDVLMAGMRNVKGARNLFVRRIDPDDGSTVWESLRPIDVLFNPFRPALVEDAATQTVLVGASRNENGVVARFALGDGALVDEDIYDAATLGLALATAIAPYGSGGYVVTGPGLDLSDGYHTLATDSAGGVLWHDTELGAITNVFTPAWLGVTPQGDVVVGGGPETMCGLFEFRVWKVSAQGRRLWTVKWPNTPALPCASAEPAAFVMAPDGSVAMTGITGGSTNDVAVLHVDPAGAFWGATWDGPNHFADRGLAIGSDSAGNIIVGGYSLSSASSNAKAVALAWSPAGQLLFSRIDNGNPVMQEITALRIGDHGSYKVAGRGSSAGQNTNIFAGSFLRQLSPADITLNGKVNIDDLLAVIAAWGPCPPSPPALPGSCEADIAPPLGGNGMVDVDDLLGVINQWSP